LSEAEESLAELEELALSADVVVLDKIIQRRPKIDTKTVLGQGKLRKNFWFARCVLGAEFNRVRPRTFARAGAFASEATDLKVIDRRS
jgi:GTP-binding protein HflX